MEHKTVFGPSADQHSAKFDQLMEIMRQMTTAVATLTDRVGNIEQCYDDLQELEMSDSAASLPQIREGSGLQTSKVEQKGKSCLL